MEDLLQGRKAVITKRSGTKAVRDERRTKNEIECWALSWAEKEAEDAAVSQFEKRIKRRLFFLCLFKVWLTTASFDCLPVPGWPCNCEYSQFCKQLPPLFRYEQSWAVLNCLQIRGEEKMQVMMGLAGPGAQGTRTRTLAGYWRGKRQTVTLLLFALCLASVQCSMNTLLNADAGSASGLESWLVVGWSAFFLILLSRLQGHLNKLHERRWERMSRE